MSARGAVLYRRLLRLHRALPPDMRRLGDAYIGEEFRKHRAAKPSFLPPFFAAWERYAAELESSAAAAAAAAAPIAVAASLALEGELRASLNEEQRETLDRLHREVVAAER